MNAYKIALLAWLALSALLIVLGVGKPRKPTTPGLAAASVVAVGVLAALVVLA